MSESTNPFLGLTVCAVARAFLAERHGDRGRSCSATSAARSAISTASRGGRRSASTRWACGPATRSDVARNRTDYVFFWLGAALGTRSVDDEHAPQARRDRLPGAPVGQPRVDRAGPGRIPRLPWPTSRRCAPKSAPCRRRASLRSPASVGRVRRCAPPSLPGVTEWGKGAGGARRARPRRKRDRTRLRSCRPSSGTTAGPGALITHRIWRKAWDMGERIGMTGDDCSPHHPHVRVDGDQRRRLPAVLGARRPRCSTPTSTQERALAAIHRKRCTIAPAAGHGCSAWARTRAARTTTSLLDARRLRAQHRRGHPCRPREDQLGIPACSRATDDGDVDGCAPQPSGRPRAYALSQWELYRCRASRSASPIRRPGPSCRPTRRANQVRGYTRSRRATTRRDAGTPRPGAGRVVPHGRQGHHHHRGARVVHEPPGRRLQVARVQRLTFRDRGRAGHASGRARPRWWASARDPWLRRAAFVVANPATPSTEASSSPTWPSASRAAKVPERVYFVDEFPAHRRLGKVQKFKLRGVRGGRSEDGVPVPRPDVRMRIDTIRGSWIHCDDDTAPRPAIHPPAARYLVRSAKFSP